MSAIILTGSSGFVGSAIKLYLESKGHHIITLGQSEGCDFQLDLKNLNSSFIAHLPKKINKIIHCAAINETAIKNNLKAAYDVNVTYTRLLCDVFEKCEVDEFIYLSTFHVYGKYSGSISISDACNPVNDYGLTHLLSEQLLINICHNKNVKLKLLRPTNLFGVPEDIETFKRWTLVPYAFFRDALTEGKITINGKPDEVRNFCHLVNLLGFLEKNTNHTVINVYGLETMSIADFALHLKDYFARRLYKHVDVILPFRSKEMVKPDLEFCQEEDYCPRGTLWDYFDAMRNLIEGNDIARD